MKKQILILFLFLFQSVLMVAQPPQTFQYQAVLRSLDGKALANQDVEIDVSILQGNINGVSVFTETHNNTTNAFGLVNLQIGSANPSAFKSIDWGAGPYFIQISVDGEIIGTSQLLSVPYALRAATVEFDEVNDADADPTNELQDISFSNGELSISKGSSIPLSSILPKIDTSNTNELQDISLSGDELSISNGSTVILPDQVNDADADPLNEIQILSINADTIFLSNGGYVKLPAGFDGDFNSLSNIPPNLDTDDTDDFDGQYSSLSGTPQNVSEFNNDAGFITSPDDNDADPANEIQLLTINGDTIFLSNGGYVKLPAGFDGDFNSLGNIPPNLDTDCTNDFDGQYSSLSGAPQNLGDFNNDEGYITSPDDADADPANELQLLSINGDTIFLSNGGYVKLPAGFNGDFNSLRNIPPNLDTDATDDFDGQYSSLEGAPQNVSEFNNDAGYITSPNDADADPTNEIQDISLSGHQLSISGGSSVFLPDEVNDNDADPTNELQQIWYNNGGIYLSQNGGFAKIPDETDPVYSASQAASITATDISNLANLSGTNSGDQDLTGLLKKADVADSILANQGDITISEAQISDLDHFTNADETDPVFSASQAASITATDISNLANLSGTNSGDQDLTGLLKKTDVADSILANQGNITISEAQISDLGHFTNADETDPVFSASQAANISAADITNLGNLSGVNSGDQDLSGLLNKADVADSILANQANITISEAQISDLGHFTNADENDPVFSASHAVNISAADITNLGNLSGTNSGDQDLTGLLNKADVADSIIANQASITISEAQISDLGHFTNADETDPVYSASHAVNISAADITNLGNLSGTNSGDQDLTGLLKKTDVADSILANQANITISEAQISDLGHFTNADETDPVFSSSLAKQIDSSDTTRWGQDNDSTNELQALRISNDTIYLTNGGFVKLPGGTNLTLDDAYNNGRAITADAGAFEVNGADGVVFSGTPYNGEIPASGAGTRMMWYPAKAAFRAGIIDIANFPARANIWDKDSIGYSSVAMGSTTKANGDYSTALGQGTTASGAFSTALGNRTTASGVYSTSMGNTTIASGAFSTAMGYNTKALGRSSVAMGEENTAGGAFSTAMGDRTTASGVFSTAMGDNTTASGAFSTSMGHNTTADGDFSTALGDSTHARAYASVALGKHNIGGGSATTWVGTDPLFEIGNGIDENNRSNAVTVLKNGNTGIGTASPDASAILDVNSSSKGVLLPHLTSQEIVDIPDPANGLLVFCTDDDNFYTFISAEYTWKQLAFGTSYLTSPAVYTIGTGSSCSNTTANGAFVIGDDLNASHFVTLDANVTSKGAWNISTGTENGYSFNGSGVFTSTGTVQVTLYGSGNPTSVQTDNFTATADNGGGSCSFSVTTEVGTIVSNTGRIWMDRNLGAPRVATSYSDSETYGDYFQWGRFSEGHEKLGSSVLTTTATTATPNAGNPWDGLFISNSSSTDDWLTPQNNNLWQGVNGANNPCPQGFRLPTQSEWETEIASWTTPNSQGAFSALKLTLGGYRNWAGNLSLSGGYGLYWSTSTNGTQAVGIMINSISATANDSPRMNAYSVRCIKE